jgi:hypothetical protein
MKLCFFLRLFFPLSPPTNFNVCVSPLTPKTFNDRNFPTKLPLDSKNIKPHDNKHCRAIPHIISNCVSLGKKDEMKMSREKGKFRGRVEFPLERVVIWNFFIALQDECDLVRCAWGNLRRSGGKSHARCEFSWICSEIGAWRMCNFH